MKQNAKRKTQNAKRKTQNAKRKKQNAKRRENTNQSNSSVVPLRWDDMPFEGRYSAKIIKQRPAMLQKTTKDNPKRAVCSILIFQYPQSVSDYCFARKAAYKASNTSDASLVCSSLQKASTHASILESLT